MSPQLALEVTKMCARGRSSILDDGAETHARTCPGLFSDLLMMGEPQTLQKYLF